MPRGLLLKTNGSVASVPLPATAQELVSVWKSNDFPMGVFLHKMLHFDAAKKLQFFNTIDGGTISLSLLQGNHDHGQHQIGNCNFHEIPKALDTQLFYGNLLMILTIDGSTIIDLSQTQYNSLLNADISEAMTTFARTSSRGSSSEVSPLGNVVRNRGGGGGGGGRGGGRRKKRNAMDTSD